MLFLGTVALTLAGIDTGTSFGGMGASREITIAALVEPTILLAVFALSIPAGSANLGALVANTIDHPGQVASLAGVLAFVALVIVIIAETGRLPVDNPATHLELTMVHEAMVLEYAGPRLALVEWASAMRLTVLLALLANLFLPWGIAGGQPSALGRRDRRRRGRGQGRRAGGAARQRRGVHRQAAAVPGARTAGRVVSAGPARGHRRQLLHRRERDSDDRRELRHPDRLRRGRAHAGGGAHRVAPRPARHRAAAGLAGRCAGGDPARARGPRRRCRADRRRRRGTGAARGGLAVAAGPRAGRRAARRSARPRRW